MRKRKHETRKKVKKVRNQRHKRQTKRRSHRSRSQRHRSHRLRGGNYAEDVTIETIDNMSVIKDAVITIPGYPSMDAEAFKRHADYIDFQGTRT